MIMREVPPYEVALGAERRPRDLAAGLLRSASRALDGLAQRLALVPAEPVTEQVVEFYGDAGAPEGALYVNGVLVGHVLGVHRL